MFDIHVLTNFQDTINQKANCQVLPTINSKKNTRRNTSWGVSVFKEWCNCHNKDLCTLKRCPEDLLQVSYPTTFVDYWLATFVPEARRKDGDYYPGNTLKNLLAALFPSHEKQPWSSQCYEFYRQITA